MVANLYDFLGVSKDCTEVEIQRAFRRLSKRFHPDQNIHKSANIAKESSGISELFHNLVHARDTLVSPTLRKQHDDTLELSGTLEEGLVSDIITRREYEKAQGQLNCRCGYLYEKMTTTVLPRNSSYLYLTCPGCSLTVAVSEF